MSHSPEPWRLCEYGISDKSHLEIWCAGVLELPNPYLISKENLERIVACVNACEGISTEELKEIKLKDKIQTLEERITELGYDILNMGERM